MGLIIGSARICACPAIVLTKHLRHGRGLKMPRSSCSEEECQLQRIPRRGQTHSGKKSAMPSSSFGPMGASCRDGKQRPMWHSWRRGIAQQSQKQKANGNVDVREGLQQFKLIYRAISLSEQKECSLI